MEMYAALPKLYLFCNNTVPSTLGMPFRVFDYSPVCLCQLLHEKSKLKLNPHSMDNVNRSPHYDKLCLRGTWLWLNQTNRVQQISWQVDYLLQIAGGIHIYSSPRPSVIGAKLAKQLHVGSSDSFQQSLKLNVSRFLNPTTLPPSLLPLPSVLLLHPSSPLCHPPTQPLTASQLTLVSFPATWRMS